MPEHHYLFVDGGYLRGVLERFSRECFEGTPLLPYPPSLCHGFRKTFYYDCPVPQKKGEPAADHRKRLEEQSVLFEEIRQVDGAHVFEGVIRGRGSGERIRQKKIDVALAVDALQHAHLKNAQQITLLTGDLDFLPLVQALVQVGIHVQLWYEESSAAKELVLEADARKVLDLRAVLEVLYPKVREDWPPAREATLDMLPTTEPVAIAESRFGVVKVYQHLDGYAALIVPPGPRGRYSCRVHPNVNFLMMWVESQWKFSSWSVRPAQAVQGSRI